MKTPLCGGFSSAARAQRRLNCEPKVRFPSVKSTDSIAHRTAQRIAVKKAILTLKSHTYAESIKLIQSISAFVKASLLQLAEAVILLAVWAIAPVELPLTVAIAKTADVVKECFEKITT